MGRHPSPTGKLMSHLKNASSTARSSYKTSQRDLDIIKTPDDEYHVLTWPEVRSIIAQNRLDVFQRLPSELRRYFAYNYQIKLQYGSLMAFVLSQKLGWTHPMVAEAEPFKSKNDISIKWNDWPYGIDDKIVHLVVWTKFDLAEDPVTTDLTDEARAEIDAYVKEVFAAKVGEENVVWFKNWKSIKSIHSVEHFHVMLYDPDPAFIDDMTGGDIPLTKKGLDLDGQGGAGLEAHSDKTRS